MRRFNFSGRDVVRDKLMNVEEEASLTLVNRKGQWKRWLPEAIQRAAFPKAVTGSLSLRSQTAMVPWSWVCMDIQQLGIAEAYVPELLWTVRSVGSRVFIETVWPKRLASFIWQAMFLIRPSCGTHPYPHPSRIKGSEPRLSFTAYENIYIYIYIYINIYIYIYIYINKYRFLSRNILL